MGEGRQWYFYSRKTQERVTSNGYWGSMGMDEPIYTSSTHKKVGIKKYLTFYLGDSQTNWIMQEYSLPDSSSSSSRSSKRSSRASSSSSHKPVSTRLFHKPKVVSFNLKITFSFNLKLVVDLHVAWIFVCRIIASGYYAECMSKIAVRKKTMMGQNSHAWMKCFCL